MNIREIEWFLELLRKSREIEERDPTPILGWLEEKRKAARFTASLIGISELREWYAAPGTGSIHHQSGEFFSVQGVRVTATGLREVSIWDQPIFTQKEGGILALVCKQEGKEILFLLNAKAEPGNIGTLQLAPTLSASWSNLKRAHKGKRPIFADILLGEVPSRLVYKALHNEEGSRFWFKTNTNQIHLVNAKETPLDYDKDQFIWASLSQIKAMALMDNIINPYVKTIIAPL